MKHTDVVKYFVSQKETNLQEQHNVCQIILTIMTEGSNPSFSTNIKQVYWIYMTKRKSLFPYSMKVA